MTIKGRLKALEKRGGNSGPDAVEVISLRVVDVGTEPGEPDAKPHVAFFVNSPEPPLFAQDGETADHFDRRVETRLAEIKQKSSCTQPPRKAQRGQS